MSRRLRPITAGTLRSLCALTIAVCLLTVGASALQAKNADAATTAPFFGTLVTDPAHAQTESQSGIKVSMLELNWGAYEPAEGQYDSNYVSQMRSRLAALQSAGMRVTLALGVHNPPQWAFNLPNSRFIDQNGNRAGEINVVFNQAMRQQVSLYYARVSQDLGIKNFWSVRLTSGGDAEILYPGGGSYWAFDANAQNGPNMPPSMSRNPFPGWKPGMTSLTTAQVGQWADWYVRALDDTVNWQMQDLNGLGFQGYYQLLTPGSGTRPGGFASDVAHNLPNGVTGVGAVWDRFYDFLPDKRNVVAYVSSMADLSGGDDSCQPGDAATPLSSPVADSWSASRWISRIANQEALPVAGENPGWNYPATMNSHYVDSSSSGMLADAVRQLTSCHFQGMYWAHDDKIWDGTMPLSRYAAAISQVNPGGNSPPAFPPGAVTPSAPTYLSVDDTSQGTGMNQLSFTGGHWSHCTACSTTALYGGSTSWSSTSGDAARISFNGTGISLYGELDPRHGIAAVSVDGGAEVPVDFFASTRREGVKVWASPTLTSGSHVLSVRVTGTKNVKSSSAIVPLDRVVITVPGA